MSAIKKLESVLRDMIKVLSEEKAILIRGDGEALMAITKKKLEYIDKIKAFEDMDLSEAEAVKSLVAEIDALQETNYLLTQQALSFQDHILKALSKSNTSRYNTYSSKGTISGQKEISIVDQSV